MKTLKQGYSLIEVMLFLALSGLVLMGIIIGTANAVDRQRYNDSVQNFAEFLRSVYSDVSNPAGPKDGRSNYSIYGKLVTFGEQYDTEYQENKEEQIYVYDVIGAINERGLTGSVLQVLEGLGLNTFIPSPDDVSIKTYVSTPQIYTLNWEAKVKDINKNRFVGSILIVRSPTSGTIYTFSSTEQPKVNQILGENPAVAANPLSSLSTKFSPSNQLDFCIVPEGYSVGTHRDVRIASNAHDASSIELIPENLTENKCI